MSELQWTLVETATAGGGWVILDDCGSVHGKYNSVEDALNAATNDAEEAASKAVSLRYEADDEQEVADGLYALVAKVEA